MIVACGMSDASMTIFKDLVRSVFVSSVLVRVKNCVMPAVSLGAPNSEWKAWM